MIFLVQFGIKLMSTCKFFQRLQIALGILARSVLFVLEKNLLVLIYSKLQLKSCDSLY